LVAVTKEADGLRIERHGCRRGEDYARDEFTSPKRIVTTTVLVKGAEEPLVPVRSSVPVPRDLQRDIVRHVSAMVFTAPVRRGQILAADVLGAGADIVAAACRGRFIDSNGGL
jgi:CxxC motif-containing protein